MVMYLHFFGAVEPTGAFLHLLDKFASFGQTGVSIFFVLSGFLITRILMETKGTTRYFSDFYIRRSLRIFPLYYFFLIISFYVVPALQRAPLVPLNNQIYFWVYLQNFAMTFNWKLIGPWHFWSLAVEEHFYLMWPLLVFFLNKRGIKVAVVAILVIAYEVFYLTFTRMDELAIGALLSVWESDGKLTGKAKLFLVSFFLTLIPTILIWIKFTGQQLVIIQTIKYNLLSTSCFCLVGYVVSLKQGLGLNKILASRFFSFSGKISYGLYVYHPLVFALIINHLPQGTSVPLLFVVCFAATYLVAFLSFSLLESKFIALKKYFEYNRPLPKAVPGSEL
jgi:peptidoglycan/LPS O-acetylase OafA/YrhL